MIEIEFSSCLWAFSLRTSFDHGLKLFTQKKHMACPNVKEDIIVFYCIRKCAFIQQRNILKTRNQQLEGPCLMMSGYAPAHKGLKKVSDVARWQTLLSLKGYQ